MDNIQHLSQSFDQNEVFIIQNYNQKCNIHHQRLDILKTDNNSNEQMLKCIQCLASQYFKFIPLKLLLDSDASTIFQGWPILDDSQIYDQLKQIPKKEVLIKKNCEEIQNFYKSFRQEINNLIDKKEKDSLINAQKRYDSFEYPLDIYNKISQKEKLRDLILNQHEDYQKQNEEFSKIVGDNLVNQELRKNLIQDSLNNFQSHKINLESQNQIKDQIIQLINQISDFSLNQELRIINWINLEPSYLSNQGEYFVQEVRSPNYLQKRENNFLVSETNFDKLNNDFDFELKNIKYLSKISQNSSIGLSKQQIIFSLQNLNQIYNSKNISIQLNDSQVQDQQAYKIAQTLENCLAVTSLDLRISQNQISKDGVKYLAESLKKCQNITELILDISNNNIQSEGANYFAQYFQSQDNITDLCLYLQKNNIEDEGAYKIMSALEKCQNIKDLIIGFGENNISKTGAQLIAYSFERFQNIVNLNLCVSNNTFREKGVLEIVKALENCNNLKNLTLFAQQNNITAENAKDIGLSLLFCKNITKLTLNLKNNNLESQKNEIEDFLEQISNKEQFLEIYM